MKDLFFGSVSDVTRMLVIGTLTYFLLILFLRVTGKRALSKMNAFDLVITVALGSSFATVMLDNSIALMEGVAALGLLILLQYVVTFTAVRSERIRRLIKSDPTLLYYQGEFLEKNMKKERILKMRSISMFEMPDRATMSRSRQWCWKPMEPYRF